MSLSQLPFSLTHHWDLRLYYYYNKKKNKKKSFEINHPNARINRIIISSFVRSLLNIASFPLSFDSFESLEFGFCFFLFLFVHHIHSHFLSFNFSYIFSVWHRAWLYGMREFSIWLHDVPNSVIQCMWERIVQESQHSRHQIVCRVYHPNSSGEYNHHMKFTQNGITKW